MAAARMSPKWFRTRRTLTPEQKFQAADAFGAEGMFLIRRIAPRNDCSGNCNSTI
jgi:hypothetical protein